MSNRELIKMRQEVIDFIVRHRTLVIQNDYDTPYTLYDLHLSSMELEKLMDILMVCGITEKEDERVLQANC